MRPKITFLNFLVSFSNKRDYLHQNAMLEKNLGQIPRICPKTQKQLDLTSNLVLQSIPVHQKGSILHLFHMSFYKWPEASTRRDLQNILWLLQLKSLRNCRQHYDKVQCNMIYFIGIYIYVKNIFVCNIFYGFSCVSFISFFPNLIRQIFFFSYNFFFCIFSFYLFLIILLYKNFIALQKFSRFKKNDKWNFLLLE